jgi:hypothetical protein
MISISKEDVKLIKAFVENKPLMEAVRRVMTAKIYEHGGVKTSTTNFVFPIHTAMDDKSNADFGEKVRVMVQALYEVDNAFQAMVLGVRATEQKKPKEEEAR